MSNSPRQTLLQCYAAALAAVDGRSAVTERLAGMTLDCPHYVVAIGKAAPAMCRGAVDVLGPNLAAALVVTRHGYGEHFGDPRIALVESGHPVPDAASLAAGQTLLSFIAAAAPGAPFIFLISGGASALVEVLPSGIGLEQLHAANAWLLASGWDIARMNGVRRALSCIKGGRLVRHLAGHPVLNLLLSDVPGDDPATIGSGLLAAPAEVGDRAGLPPWLAEALGCAPPPAAPEQFAAVTSEILRTNRDARAAAAACGFMHGVEVHVTSAPLQDDAARCGRQLAELLRAGPHGFYVWGGETTVALPPNPGRGGRCQQLALAAAEVLEGRGDIYLLAGATDGSDGPTEDAGALVDGGTVARGALAGLSSAAALAGADAGSFLEESGDLLQTGPTGSNVMDLVLALKLP